MVDATGMTAEEVHRVVGALAEAGCVSWLEGGWGVDALVGRQTRRHRDLDLAFDASHEDVALEVLASLGYVLETDWRPVRFEVAAPPSRFVDMHPVVLDEDGNGVQAGPDGTTFDYPSASFTTGTVCRTSDELHLRRPAASLPQRLRPARSRPSGSSTSASSRRSGKRSY